MEIALNGEAHVQQQMKTDTHLGAEQRQVAEAHAGSGALNVISKNYLKNHHTHKTELNLSLSRQYGMFQKSSQKSTIHLCSIVMTEFTTSASAR